MNILTGILGSPIWVGVITFWLGLVLGFVVVSTVGTGSRVMLIRERDRRGKQYGIAKEDPIKIVTGGKEPIRIYKYRGAYEFAGALGKKVTTFFAKEGTAYNMSLESNPVDMRANFGDLAKIVWGEAFYKTLPEDRQAQMSQNSLFFTVRPEETITPPGFAAVNETMIKQDGNEAMANAVARGVTKGMAVPWINYIFAIGCGTGLTFALCLAMNWIRIV